MVGLIAKSNIFDKIDVCFVLGLQKNDKTTIRSIFVDLNASTRDHVPSAGHNRDQQDTIRFYPYT